MFFPESDPATGTLLSFATYGVGYVARPVGAFFMGHIGDKFGRKRVLILTVTMMGVSTFLVGCLPSYNSIGAVGACAARGPAPDAGLLRLGRAGQRELAHARARARRTGARSSRASRSAARRPASIIATAVFLPIGTLPDEQLLTWGWRIPFWLSAFVVARRAC